MMTPKQFAEYYDIDYGNVNMFIHKNRGASWMEDTGKGVLLDNKKLEFMQTTRKLLWLSAHYAYFQISSFGISDAEQARVLQHITDKTESTWYVFLNSDLFRTLPMEITKVQPLTRLRSYLRGAQAILKVIHRHGWKEQ